MALAAPAVPVVAAVEVEHPLKRARRLSKELSQALGDARVAAVAPNDWVAIVSPSGISGIPNPVMIAERDIWDMASWGLTVVSASVDHAINDRLQALASIYAQASRKVDPTITASWIGVHSDERYGGVHTVAFRRDGLRS